MRRLPITYWNYLLSIMFLFKKNVEYFSSVSIWTIKFVYAVVLSIALKLLVHDILRIICHFEFWCRSISFQKQRKQTVKLANLSLQVFKSFLCLTGRVAWENSGSAINHFTQEYILNGGSWNLTESHCNLELSTHRILWSLQWIIALNQFVAVLQVLPTCRTCTVSKPSSSTGKTTCMIYSSILTASFFWSRFLFSVEKKLNFFQINYDFVLF